MKRMTHRRVTLKDLGQRPGLSARAVSHALCDGEGTVNRSQEFTQNTRLLEAGIPLRSAGQPHEKIHARAVADLIAQTKGESPLADRLEMQQCRMIIRQSSVRRKLASLREPAA